MRWPMQEATTSTRNKLEGKQSNTIPPNEKVTRLGNSSYPEMDQGKLNQKSSTRISSVGEFRKEAHFLPKLASYLERTCTLFE